MASRIPVTSADLRAAIERLDLAGKPVCIHSSLRSFGAVQGGAQSVIDAFINASCTVLVPTFSSGFAVPPTAWTPLRNGWHYDHPGGASDGPGRIFTAKSNDIDRDMGAIPERVLASPGRIRGEHPLCSFAAIGPLAQDLVTPQTHDDVMAPLRVLAEQAGVVLTMGVGLTSVTLLHLAEEMAERALFVRWANDNEGQPVEVRTGGCSEGFDRLEEVVEPFAARYIVGTSEWTRYDAAPALIAAAQAIRESPEITHCGRDDCERCNDAVLGGPI